MKHRIGSRYVRLSLQSLLPVIVVAGLTAPMPARANMIITVGNATANQGSSGNSLDVTLTNTGPGVQNIAAFSFEISTTDTDITFTEVNISTIDPYIFTDSLFGPTISSGTPNPGPGQTIDASDLSSGGLGTDIASGATYGLGHVLFDISPGATLGIFDVTLNTTTPGSTSLSDSFATAISYSGVNGTITIQAGSPVPEPGTLMLMLLAAPVIALNRRRLR